MLLVAPIMVAFFVSGVGWASEVNPGSSVIVGESIKEETSKLREPLTQNVLDLGEDFFRIVYMPGKGGIFSATYDTRHPLVTTRCRFDGFKMEITQEIKVFLRFASLRGLSLKKGFAHKASWNHVDASRYEPCQFFSKWLKDFLFDFCSDLEDKEDHSVSGWQPLTGKMLQGIVTLFQTFKWSVEENDSLEESVAQRRCGKDTVLICAPGVGVFRGVRHRSYCKFASELYFGESSPLFVVGRNLAKMVKSSGGNFDPHVCLHFHHDGTFNVLKPAQDFLPEAGVWRSSQILS